MAPEARRSDSALSVKSAEAKGRSKSDMAKLIQKRAKERDEWLVYGVPEKVSPTATEMLHFVGKILPKYMKFQPMSQEELNEQFPVQTLDWNRLDTAAQDRIQITWLGHASLLVQMGGYNLVTDPVFSERCSASQWVGPKRYRQPPCPVHELCNNIDIHMAIITHNHYDHLDYQSVKDLYKYSKCAFVVPLGLKEWIQKNVSRDAEIYELDWHESMEYNIHNDSTSKENESPPLPLHITSVPMRHWSNRTGKRDDTLWCGFSVAALDKKFLFPGDTAWFDDLAKIGQEHGPFDVAAIPIGAYEPREFMKKNHINVEEGVMMKDAVQAKAAVPIHWGTFPLTTEPVLEPREKLRELMKDRPDAESFEGWLIGETRTF